MLEKTESAHIEFVGLPGSGKTTLARLYSKNKGIPLKYDLISKSLAHNLNFKLKVLLQFHKFWGKDIRLYDAWAYYRIKSSLVLQEKIRDADKALCAIYRFNSKDLSQLPLLRTSLARDIVFSWDVFEKQISSINDDGVLQRLISILGLRGRDIPNDVKEAVTIDICSLLPENILIVFLDLEAKEALQRASIRTSGIPELIKNEKNVLEKFEDTEQYLKILKNVLRSRKVRVISMNAKNSISHNLDNLLSII